MKLVLRRGKAPSYLYDLVVIAFCLTFGLICFYPLWYVFLGSISNAGSAAVQGIDILPPLKPFFGYYSTLMKGAVFQRAMLVSVSITLIGSLGSVLLTGAMAYGCSKTKVKFMKFLNFYMVMTMFFGGGLIPTFLLIKNLHLYNTYWVLFIVHLLSAWNYILMRNYFYHAIPSEIEDAGVVDGASEAGLFFRIIIPISMPLFATIFLFQAVAIWNDWFTYLIYVDDTQLQPFIVVLQRLLVDPNVFLRSQGVMIGYAGNMPATALKMTTIMLAMIPILILYPFLQKYFTKGMLIGAVKG